MSRNLQIKNGTVRKVNEDYYHITASGQNGDMVAMYVDNLEIEGAEIEIEGGETDVSGAYASYGFSSERTCMSLNFN